LNSIIGSNTRKTLNNAKKIVIKIGTSSLTYATGKINFQRIDILSRVISDLTNQGKEVVLVTSGAIGVGVDKLKLGSKPNTVSGRQAAAAVGQCTLMQIYSKTFAEYGHDVGQMLLTRDVIDKEVMKNNAINTFEELFKMGVIPVVNENDSVSVEEIQFGDNDNLSSLVSRLIKAELLVILTDIDGYYDKNPREFDDANLIHTITDLSEKVEAAAGSVGSAFGTGGMLTKVHACRLAAENGIDAIIANGNDPKVIYRILNGDEVGTLFVSK